MGRRYDTAFYAELVARVRRATPGVAVHADLIVGFPGEDDAAWERTAAFLRGLDLAGVHVFRYSARPGTPAARMIGQVDGKTKKRRAAEALALSAAARASFAGAADRPGGARPVRAATPRRAVAGSRREPRPGGGGRAGLMFAGPRDRPGSRGIDQTRLSTTGSWAVWWRSCRRPSNALGTTSLCTNPWRRRAHK